MDTLFSLKVFRQVVECGSFTRAAEQLNISNAMASKHVRHLEQSIQAKLLHRNNRNLHLTEAGEHYYRECSYALDTLHNAAAKAAQGTDQPQGELRLTMPLWFANQLFAQWMSEYCQRYPAVKLNISLDNKHNNLIADGFDLALRVSETPAPSLIVKPLADIQFQFVASPAYLARYSQPYLPEDLLNHHIILPTYTDMSQLSFQKAEQTITLHLSSAMSSNNTLMIYQLILAGAGVGCLPTWLLQNDLAAGKLVVLLPEYHIRTVTLYAAYVDRAYLSAKVRSFIDFLSEKIQQFNKNA